MAEWADLRSIPTEAKNTAPHAVAPHPERWHAPDSDSTECEVSELIGALVRALQPDLVVETGTAFGYTTAEIGKALTANGHGRCVSLEVDPGRIAYAGSLIGQLIAMTEIGPQTIEIREQSSLDYLPDQPIDFAWFDSLYELRAQEFVRFRELGALKPGTICGFHDTTSGLRRHYLDVRAEVERLQRQGLLRAIFLPTPRGVALAEVL